MRKFDRKLNAKSVNDVSDGQLVYVSDSGSLFKANVTPANPPISFANSQSEQDWSLLLDQTLLHKFLSIRKAFVLNYLNM